MPLTARDIQYLNNLLDKHLKYQHSWPWLRYFMLLMNAIAIALGLWAGSMAVSMSRNMTIFDPPATRPAASTEPVTRKEMQMTIDATAYSSRVDTYMDQNISEFSLATGVMGLVFMVFGFIGIFQTLERWNRHRRDIILITLLREKCAAELAMPMSQSH